MKFFFARFLLLSLIAILPAQARTIKITTWNLEWLTLRPQGDHALPSGVAPKTADAIARLHDYAAKLDSDVIAFEEVDGPDMAARIFPADRYQIVTDDGNEVQRVGFAIRRDIKFQHNPDLSALNLGHRGLRAGVDVTLDLDGHTLRLLGMHLKSGCAGGNFSTEYAEKACRQLGRQLPVLQDWITARAADSEAFALLGDFNRRMYDREKFWNQLESSAPLTLTDEGEDSPCWGGDSFIDHVILGGAARGWEVPNSLRVLVYREKDKSFKETLSDHCPVSVQLDVK